MKIQCNVIGEVYAHGVKKLHSLCWMHKVEIEDGVQKLFEWRKAS